MKKTLRVFTLSYSMLTGLPAMSQELPADVVTVAKASIKLTQFGGDIALRDVDTDQASALVGHGFDPITGRVLDMQCVVANGPEFRMEKGAAIPFKRKSLVVDQKSYASASSSSAGISAVFKAVQLGVGTSHATGSSINSVDSYGRLFNRIATKGGEYLLVKWAPATGTAPSPLTLLKTDRKEFLNQCGTYFVKGVYSGQQLDTLTSFVMRQEEKDTANATSVSISVAKIFGASASVASAVDEANQHSDAYLENNGKGALGVAIIAASGPGPGDGSPPPVASGTPPASAPAAAPPSASVASASAGASATVPTDASGIKSMLGYYENGFAMAVGALTPDELDKTALPLYIIVEHYRGNIALERTSEIPNWADDVYDAVNSKIDTYNALVKVIADLESALAPGTNPRLGVFYENPDKPDPKDPTKTDPSTTAPARLKAAKDMLKAFQGAVKACQSLITAGVEKPGKQKQTAAAICQDGLDAKLKDDDVTRLALIRKY